MFSFTKATVYWCADRLQATYRQTFGGFNSAAADLIAEVTHTAIAHIARSDAPYHDIEHTLLVTLTGQEMLRGKQIREGGVSSSDWLNSIISLLCHDMGYLKGVCGRDCLESGRYITGTPSGEIALSADATDASLTPYHVDRSKLFVREYFANCDRVDLEVIERNIELTRFPIPPDDEHQETTGYGALVRSADLIGQLADPHYLQKLPALYQEFEETGANKHLGYRHVSELRASFPNFFWNAVYPYIQEGLHYLEATQRGRQMIASLYANVCVVERELQTATPTLTTRPFHPEIEELVLQTAASRASGTLAPFASI